MVVEWFKELELDHFFLKKIIFNSNLGLGVMSDRLLSKVEVQNFSLWSFSSRCSQLFVMSSLLFSWFFSCVTNWWYSFHSCSPHLWLVVMVLFSLLWFTIALVHMSPSSFSSSYGVGCGHHGLIVVVVSSCPPSNSWSYYLVVLIVMVVVIFSLLQIVIAHHHPPNLDDLVVLVIIMIFLLL